MSSPRTEEMLCLSPLTSQTKVHLLGRTQEHLQLQLRHSPWVLSRAEASHKLGNCSSFSRFLSKGKKEYYHSDFLDYSVCLLLPTLVTTGLFFKLQSALPKSKYLLLKHWIKEKFFINQSRMNLEKYWGRGGKKNWITLLAIYSPLPLFLQGMFENVIIIKTKLQSDLLSCANKPFNLFFS